MTECIIWCTWVSILIQAALLRRLGYLRYTRDVMPVEVCWHANQFFNRHCLGQSSCFLHLHALPQRQRSALGIGIAWHSDVASLTSFIAAHG